MKILHIGKFYPPFYGGMENYLQDLATVQAKDGHDVTVWVHNHDWQKISSATVQSNDHDGKLRLIRQKSLKPVLFTPLMLGFGRQLKRIIKQQAPDVIHLHCPNPSLFQILWQRSARGIPWVVSWHADMVTANSSWLMKLVYKLIKPLETRLIRRAMSLLVSTQAYADYSIQLKNFYHKVKVVPLGMATTELDALGLEQGSALLQRTKQYWQVGDFRLFHLGRLTFYKNQSFLINAMQALSGVQLLIAGSGQLHHRLQTQIDELQLGQQVSLLGGLGFRQAHELFATSQVFCMASDDRAESFGVVLLEAMYHDKVILVPDTAGSGMAWLAKNYHKGFTYQVNNSADFIEKLNYIQQNYSKISQLPKQFNYPIEKIARKIEQHYRSLIIGDKV